MDDPENSPRDPDPGELARRIDELMAGPIKQPPAVTVFGDDAVTGFTPALATRPPETPAA